MTTPWPLVYVTSSGHIIPSGINPKNLSSVQQGRQGVKGLQGPQGPWPLVYVTSSGHIIPSGINPNNLSSVQQGSSIN